MLHKTGRITWWRVFPLIIEKPTHAIQLQNDKSSSNQIETSPYKHNEKKKGGNISTGRRDRAHTGDGVLVPWAGSIFPITLLCCPSLACLCQHTIIMNSEHNALPWIGLSAWLWCIVFHYCSPASAIRHVENSIYPLICKNPLPVW